MTLDLTQTISGRGLGDGVRRAVLEEAVKMMLEDDAYWRPTLLEEGYHSLAPRDESSKSRHSQIKAYAALVMIAIYHGVCPDPVSPFLLAMLFEGESLLLDLKFITHVAPLTQVMLNDWPDNHKPPPRTMAVQTLLANLGTEVRLIAFNIP